MPAPIALTGATTTKGNTTTGSSTTPNETEDDPFPTPSSHLGRLSVLDRLLKGVGNHVDALGGTKAKTATTGEGGGRKDGEFSKGMNGLALASCLPPTLSNTILPSSQPSCSTTTNATKAEDNGHDSTGARKRQTTESLFTHLPDDWGRLAIAGETAEARKQRLVERGKEDKILADKIRVGEEELVEDGRSGVLRGRKTGKTQDDVERKGKGRSGGGQGEVHPAVLAAMKAAEAGEPEANLEDEGVQQPWPRDDDKDADGEEEEEGDGGEDESTTAMVGKKRKRGSKGKKKPKKKKRKEA